MRGLLKIGILLVAAGVVACHRVPSHVLAPDDMAQLMADIRMADAVVSIQNDDYNSDARKLALKEAVFRRHGVTEAQFDTSLVWYGHNVDRFQEVNDLTIEILEQRLKVASEKAAGEAALTVSGDSVDLWNGSPVRIFTPRTAADRVAFGFDTDRNAMRGDTYTLRGRILVPGFTSQWGMTVEYSDGSVEGVSENMNQTQPTRQEITLVTDSTRTPRHVSGWISMKTGSGRDVAVIDSLSLTRRRVNHASPIYRPYNQYRIDSKYTRPNNADTVTAQ